MKQICRYFIFFTVLLAQQSSVVAATTAYTDEASFLAALDAVFREDFDGNDWAGVRSTATTVNAATSVASQGITWSSTERVTTSAGAGRSGYGIYSSPHGIPDSLTITAAQPLMAAGGWFMTNTPPAKINFIIDDTVVADFNDIPINGQFSFRGVISTDGFQKVEFKEIEGTPGDQKYIFADDFTFSLINQTTPNTPSSLSAKAASSTQIILGWSDNSVNETGFEIDRKIGNCSSPNAWTQVAAKPANTVSHTISGLAPNTDYSFRIRAYNTGGNSPYSNCAVAKTGLSGCPPSPSNLRAASVSSAKINLTWSDNSANETGFKVYRRIGTGAWALRATTGANIKNFSDTTAANNSSTNSHQYYVVAFNSSGNSPATYASIVPYSPNGLTAAPGTTAGSVKLTWTDKSANETGFEVLRKSGNCASTSPWTKIATLGANKTTWTDKSCTSGSSYAYRIRAHKKIGAVLSTYGYSMYSGCATVTAP